MRSRDRAEEDGVTEAEDASVGGVGPVAVAVARRRDARHRLVEGVAPEGAVEAGVAEGEDPAVRSHGPVPLAARGGTIPTIGLLRGMPPIDP